MVRDLGAFVLQLIAHLADQISGLERFWTLSELLLDWISLTGLVPRSGHPAPV